MNLKENPDLAEFMKTEDIELLWKLYPISRVDEAELAAEAVEAMDLEDRREEDDEVPELVEVTRISKETKAIVENNELPRVASRPLPENHR